MSAIENPWILLNTSDLDLRISFHREIAKSCGPDTLNFSEKYSLDQIWCKAKITLQIHWSIRKSTGPFENPLDMSNGLALKIYTAPDTLPTTSLMTKCTSSIY